MSKAREIVAERFANGEITEQEFFTIVETLNNSTISKKVPLPEKMSTVSTEDTKSFPVEKKQEPESVEAQIAPQTLKNHINERIKSDLALPAQIIKHSANATIIATMIWLLQLFKSREVPNNFFEIIAGKYWLLDIPEYILGIAALVWIYRATKNLFLHHVADLKFSPGWSVGWFFVPIANIWMPIKVMRQLYLASREGNYWKKSTLKTNITLFWSFYLISSFGIEGYLFLTSMILDTGEFVMGETTRPLIFSFVYSAFFIASVYLFSSFVKEITDVQNTLPANFPNYTSVRENRV